MTKEGIPQPIIRTCLNLLIALLTTCLKASFAFVVSPLLEEATGNSKRFRVYRRVMESFFSPASFFHVEYAKGDSYLVLNRKNKQENLLKKIESQFSTFYDFPQKEA